MVNMTELLKLQTQLKARLADREGRYRMIGYSNIQDQRRSGGQSASMNFFVRAFYAHFTTTNAKCTQMSDERLSAFRQRQLGTLHSKRRSFKVEKTSTLNRVS